MRLKHRHQPVPNIEVGRDGNPDLCLFAYDVEQDLVTGRGVTQPNRFPSRGSFSSLKLNRYSGISSSIRVQLYSAIAASSIPLSARTIPAATDDLDAVAQVGWHRASAASSNVG